MNQHLENGERLLQEGQLEGAQAAYEKALELSPDSADALYGMAKTLAMRADAEAAILRYRGAIAIEARAEGLSQLAELLLVHGSEEEVSELLAKAAELDPDLAAIFVIRAELASRHERFDEASELLKKAVRRGAEIPEQTIFRLYQKNIQQLLEDGDTEKASEVAGSAAEYFGHLHLLLLAGKAAELAKQPAVAIARYKRALSELPAGQLRLEVLEKIAALV
ncbi:MAG: tetratricopeptide repeat protein [Myxococcota bacterium]|nr:tetratricopeptide repeat protein [Myxococcota bacterium]